MKGLICIAVLIASAVQYVHGQEMLTITCYQCDSRNSEGCLDTFNADGRVTENTCTGIDPFCFKTICPDEVNGEMHTRRGCFADEITYPDYCTWDETLTDCDVCEVCKHDKCNAASQLSISLLSLFAISFVVVRNC